MLLTLNTLQNIITCFRSLALGKTLTILPRQGRKLSHLFICFDICYATAECAVSMENASMIKIIAVKFTAYIIYLSTNDIIIHLLT